MSKRRRYRGRPDIHIQRDKNEREMERIDRETKRSGLKTGGKERKRERRRQGEAGFSAVNAMLHTVITGKWRAAAWSQQNKRSEGRRRNGEDRHRRLTLCASSLGRLLPAALVLSFFLSLSQPCSSAFFSSSASVCYSSWFFSV